MVANPIDIHGSSAPVSTSAKPSTHVSVVPVGSTVEAGVIANPFNVDPAVNPLAPLGPSVASAGSSVEGGSVANLMAANPIVDIHGSSVPVSTPAKPSTDVSVVPVGFTVDAGIVSNLSADILSPFKPPTELTPNTTYEEWSKCTSCSASVVCADSWRRQICDRRDLGFLDGMYALGCVKHMSLIVCDHHLHLLASKLHLVDASPANLRSRIDLTWEHRHRTANLMSVIFEHSNWFSDTLRFI